MRLILLMTILTFSSFPSFSQIVRPTSFEGRIMCEKSYGVWRQFGNGCADECYSKFNEFSTCTDTIVSACDCGKGSCWDSESGQCILFSEYQKIFDIKQEEERKILEEARNERKERFENYRRQVMQGFVQNYVPTQNSSDNLNKFYKKEVSSRGGSNNSSARNNRFRNDANLPQPVNTAFIADEVDPSQKEKVLSSSAITPNIPPSFLEKEQAQKAAAKDKLPEVSSPIAGLPIEIESINESKKNGNIDSIEDAVIEYVKHSNDMHNGLIPSQSLLGGI